MGAKTRAMTDAMNDIQQEGEDPEALLYEMGYRSWWVGAYKAGDNFGLARVKACSRAEAAGLITEQVGPAELDIHPTPLWMAP